MSSKIVVTGGAGMIGAAVVHALLTRGQHVAVLDSGVAAGFDYLAGTDAELIRGDIRDGDVVDAATRGAAAIVHLAAQPSVVLSIEDPIGDREINVDASLLMLEAARRNEVDRFVFASSNAVIGGHPPPAHEELVPYPVSPYGAAKAAIEAYLRSFGRAYGMTTVSLRFANAYGPWSAHKSAVAPAFAKAYLAGGPLTIRGSGEQTRDFVHVDDVAGAVLACLDAPVAAVAEEIFQIGTGRETSLLELARLMFDTGGTNVAIEHTEPSPGDVQRNWSDIAKARRLLDWAPQVELRDGVAGMLEWFRDRERR